MSVQYTRNNMVNNVYYVACKNIGQYKACNHSGRPLESLCPYLTLDEAKEQVKRILKHNPNWVTITIIYNRKGICKWENQNSGTLSQ